MKNLSYTIIFFWIALAAIGCKKTEDGQIPVMSVKLDKTSMTLMVGQKDSLKAFITPDDASNQAVSWNSSDASIVQVDKQGKITAVSVGKATITVTTLSEGKTAACEIEVTKVVEGITFESAIVRITVGALQTLKTTVFRSDGKDTTLMWKSGNETVATVDSKGGITGVAEGTTEVTASTIDGKYTATCEVTVIDIKIAYSLIPAGQFMMGSPATEPNRDDDEAQHAVVLSNAFQMSKYEITNAQYCKFLTANAIGADARWKDARVDATKVLVYASNWGVRYDTALEQWVPAAGKENFPVVSTTWYGAMEFAIWVGGSLPTEAQWEYACRGNYPNKRNEVNTSPFGVGDGRKMVSSLANFFSLHAYALPSGEYEDSSGKSSAGSQEVGTYAPNNYDLYDMHGNVWEWCKDGYDSLYGSRDFAGAVVDPIGSESAAERIIKGGSWYFFARCCRSAFRHKASPEVSGNEIGFRVVHP